MPTTKRPYNPNRLTLDDGREFYADPNQPAPVGVGLEQNRLRRAQEDAITQRARETGDFAGGWGRHILAGPSFTNDAFFGLLQAKENAANASGMGFQVAPNANSVAPDTTFDEQQTPLTPSIAGLYSAMGSENPWEISRRRAGRVRGSAQSKLKVRGQRGGPAATGY